MYNHIYIYIYIYICGYARKLTCDTRGTLSGTLPP